MAVRLKLFLGRYQTPARDGARKTWIWQLRSTSTTFRAVSLDCKIQIGATAPLAISVRGKDRTVTLRSRRACTGHRSGPPRQAQRAQWRPNEGLHVAAKTSPSAGQQNWLVRHIGHQVNRGPHRDDRRGPLLFPALCETDFESRSERTSHSEEQPLVHGLVLDGRCDRRGCAPTRPR